MATSSPKNTKDIQKALFIVSLKYPMINAINIKLSLIKNKAADLILDDNQTDVIDIANRISECNIFDSIFALNTKRITRLKRSIRTNRLNFKATVREIYAIVKLKIFKLINKRKYIQQSLLIGSNINLKSYNEVFICNESPEAQTIVELLYKEEKITSINLIEEGLRDYCYTKAIDHYQQKFDKLKIKLFLYEKKLACYKVNPNVTLSDIPKLSSTNQKLLSTLNRIFGWDQNKAPLPNITFFEQVAEPIPQRLRHLPSAKRIILSNSYKKHFTEHLFYLDKFRVITAIISVLDDHDLLNLFGIKLHPRSARTPNIPWDKYIIGDKGNKINIPLEIYCLNQSFKNCIWISLFSSSVLNRLLCFSDNTSIKILLLYNCMRNTRTISPDLNTFFQKLRDIYPDQIFIPKNQLEANSILIEHAKSIYTTTHQEQHK